MGQLQLSDRQVGVLRVMARGDPIQPHDVESIVRSYNSYIAGNAAEAINRRMAEETLSMLKRNKLIRTEPAGMLRDSFSVILRAGLEALKAVDGEERSRRAESSSQMPTVPAS